MIALAELLEGPIRRESESPLQDAARARDDRAIARALQIIERRAGGAGQLLSDPETCGRFFRLRLADEQREHFEVAFLDTRHRLISAERLFLGSVDQSTVHPRIVVQRALLVNAAAVLLAHNHPSGNPEPSAADRMLTQQLKQALALVEVRVLDHFVVTNSTALSMAARGHI